ncbi:MAG: DUF4864 domain-containing protein [bacterium]
MDYWWLLWLFGSLVVFVIVIGVIFAIAWTTTSGPATASETFLNDISAGKSDEAYALTSVQFQNATSKQDFNQFVSQNPTFSHISNISFSSRDVKNGLGTLKGTITNSDGTKMPVTVKTVQENGVWKIQYLGLNDEGSSSDGGE